MLDPELYEEISQDVFARYNKDNDFDELLSLQSFLDNINNEYIKSKKDALSEFKTVKNNVKSKNLKDIVKELERVIFGYDNEEPEYEESIAERTKMRRKNKETKKKDASRTFVPPDPDGGDDESTEIYETPLNTSRDDEKMTEGETEQTEKVYDKEGYDVTGYDRWGFKKNGFNKDGYNRWGFDNYGFNKDGYNKEGFGRERFNKDGYDMWGFNKDGFNKDRKKDKEFNKLGFSINGLNMQGLDKNKYNINGYSTSGFDRQHYNINGYNHGGYDRHNYNINGYNRYGLDRKGNKRKALKKNIPGSGLKILTPQQMLARLRILLAQVQAGNNSQKLKNEIRQLLHSLSRSKKISKTVYKNLIATI